MDVMPILENIFSESGLFASLAVGLIVWQSKTNQERETRYIDTINNITINVSDKITNVENDIQDIKEALKGGGVNECN